MLDASLIKSLLSHEVYQDTNPRLRADLFGEDFRDLYKAVDEAHKKYSTDLSLDEVWAVWELTNPVATRAERAEIKDIIDDVRKAEGLNEELAKDAVETLWRRSMGKQIAEYGLEMSEGQNEAMSKLQALLERHAEGWMPDDFGDPTSDDLVELIKKVGDDGRWKFNIETLSRYVHGIGPQEFGIIFATPETGKTAFVVSLAVAPGGFVDQGAKVLILGNEESTERTQVRAASAATGLTALEIADDPEKARQIYRARKQDRLIFKDTQDWDLDRIEAYISKQKPDVVFIDQADKVQIGGLFNAGHERLRELYRRLREAAKRHNCAVFGLSQASNDATGKTRITYDMMEGSRIGKAAEADLIIGIGKHAGSSEDTEPDHSRFLTISKNKLSGWHGTIVCNIQPEVSRYVE